MHGQSKKIDLEKRFHSGKFIFHLICAIIYYNLFLKGSQLQNQIFTS